ncbi:MAG: hypothetical protein Kow0010_09090 [Dehalococcoidia bacterium]
MSLSKRRLQRLLRQRERLERAQEAALGAATRAQAQRAKAVDDTVRHRVAVVRDASGRPADALYRVTTRAHIEATDRAIEARRAALRHAGDATEREREALLARRRDRLALQTLLDRVEREERQRLARLDRRRLDEAATQGWLRERHAAYLGKEAWT